jgi:hypothetical protein
LKVEGPEAAFKGGRFLPWSALALISPAQTTFPKKSPRVAWPVRVRNPADGNMPKSGVEPSKA